MSNPTKYVSSVKYSQPPPIPYGRIAAGAGVGTAPGVLPGRYGDDAAGMVEALSAAHSFYRKGLSDITPENLVVFLIR